MNDSVKAGLPAGKTMKLERWLHLGDLKLCLMILHQLLNVSVTVSETIQMQINALHSAF